MERLRSLAYRRAAAAATDAWCNAQAPGTELGLICEVEPEEDAVEKELAAIMKAMKKPMKAKRAARLWKVMQAMKQAKNATKA